jgi:hypothetical protein
MLLMVELPSTVFGFAIARFFFATVTSTPIPTFFDIQLGRTETAIVMKQATIQFEKAALTSRYHLYISPK